MVWISISARRWFLVASVAAAITLTAWAAVVYRMRNNTRQIAIAILEERFGRDVELEELSLRILPHLEARGKGLVVYQEPDHDNLPPFISIDSFVIDVSLWTLLLVRPVRIDAVSLEELEIHIPPGGDNDGVKESRAGGRVPAFVINELTAPDTALYIHPKDPEKEALLWDIYQLHLRSAGTTEPMLFDAVLRNAKPPGLIYSSGAFGPWREDHLELTPVSGEYTFEDADLSALGGIHGVLSSQGHYHGMLGRLDVVGTTDVPDFALDAGGNSLHLKTEFSAVVDGTNGDTLLEPVRATIGGTELVANGGVVHREGLDGKTLQLEIVAEDGRLEDFLTLSMKSEEPFMTGTIWLETEFLLPQGDQDVIDKLQLEGRFRITKAVFAEPTLQERIDVLSSRSRGEPKNPERVASNFEGGVTLGSSAITLSNLTFQVPGATVELEGTFGLKSEAIDMRGRIHMDAKLSETTTGIKSFLLKLVDPFFRGERGKGSTLPIKVTGTREEPDIGLDLGWD